MSAKGVRHVAVDLGASGGRVAVGSFGDGAFHVEIVHRFPNGGVTRDGNLYWDIDRLKAEVFAGLKRAAEGGEVASVGVNSWGVDYALLDESHEMLDGVRHYRDPRTEGIIEQVGDSVPLSEIYAETGIQFMPFNTAFQLVVDQREHPDMLTRAQRMLFVPDLFHYWLCGIPANEATNASTSQLYNPFTRDWSRDLMARLGIPCSIVSKPVSAGTILGSLTPEAAEETGLGSARVVAAATHDTASAVAAVPALAGDDWAYIASGTWFLVGVESSQPVITDKTFELGLTNEAGAGGKTLLLKNVTGLWIVQECRREWDDMDYATLYAEAAASPTTARIDPDDIEFAIPREDMAERVVAWCQNHGQSVPQTRGEIVRCVVESIAEKSARLLDQIEQVTGKAIRKIHVVGGGCQIEFLNQVLADRSGRTVIAGPVEATLLGNLLIQAAAMGTITYGSDLLSTVRDYVRASHTLTTYEPCIQTGKERI